VSIVGQHVHFPKGITVESLRISGDTYSDYLISGTAVARGVSAPDLVELRNGIFLYAFDGGATVEQAFFTVHLLHDIKPGSTPTFHVHWTHNNGTPSGDVKWQIDYTYAQGYEAGTFGAPVTVSTIQTAGAQYSHHITSDDDMAVSLTGMEPDMLILCRIYRDPTDAADTFADDAFLIQVDMHYQISQIGTPERNRPFGRYTS